MTKPNEQDQMPYPDPKLVGEDRHVHSAEPSAALDASDRRSQTPQLAPQAQSPVRPAPQEGEDFYWEGPYMVFTEAWHLKRGYCCGSACRHCPFGHENVPQKSNR